MLLHRLEDRPRSQKALAKSGSISIAWPRSTARGRDRSWQRERLLASKGKYVFRKGMDRLINSAMARPYSP
jgi:hypothetical protein